MRRGMSAVVLSLVLMLPSLGNAQGADEPVLVNGLYFYPTREFRIFDASVMTQVASAQRSPVYVDSTLEANTVVYVSAGGKTMRAYRVGQPGPSVPATAVSPSPLPPAPVATALAPVVSTEGAVGTAGSTVPAVVGTGSSVAVTNRRTTARSAASRVKPPTVLTTLAPQGNQGIWIEYEGARYFADGAAAVFSPDRFTKIGERSGFPVYRAADDSNKDRIWVSVATDGPVAPYVKR